MGIFKSSKEKGFRPRIVDLRVDRWLSVDYLKETTSHFKAILNDIVVPKRARYSETFDEAVHRLHLTDSELAQRKLEFSRLFYFFIILSLFVIGYGLYFAFHGHFISAIISFCLSIYSFTQAFRFHFWLFQLKNRKLGCTLREWFNSSIDSEPRNNIVVKPDHFPDHSRKNKD